MGDDPQSRASGHRPPSRGRRLLKLTRMTASVVGDYARTQLRSVISSEEESARLRHEAHARSGERMAQTLGELKGAVMKVGQMASVAQDLLPREMADALQSLQRDAEPVPFEVIREQIERELGDDPARLFAAFDEEPFAAASIGQVHRATLDDGRPVVVKVQYPGVEESCDADLAQLRFTLRMSGLIGSRAQRAAFDELFEELRERLHEELDYTLEADNVRLFRKIHAGDDAIVIPRVIGARSAQRVLTLTYEEGDPISALTSAPYTQEVRDQIGATMCRIFGDQLFVHRTLHADPNPGNYAFRPDGTLVLYDYGCVKQLDARLVAQYRDMARAMYTEDFVRLDARLMELGARIPDGPQVPPEFYAEWRRILLEPFVREEVYDYAHSNIHEAARENLERAIDYMDSFKPAKDLVFIDRVVVGLHNAFRQFHPVIRWREFLEHYLSLEQEPLP